MPAMLAQNARAVAIHDKFPVSPGHTLIVTRRHVPDFFSCTAEERTAIFDMVDRVKNILDSRFHPDGYNVGFNSGEAAGQTVMHVHVHVIPRYKGDVEDPRGGVRYVLPGKANYLRERAEILTDGDRGGGFFFSLAPLLARASRIDIVAAFVQDSGLVLIEPAIQEALARGAQLRILTGDYLDITQVDALRRLSDWALANQAERCSIEELLSIAGNLWTRVIETSMIQGRSFHPKAWILEGPDFGAAFVGSSNLSRSALNDGVEWNLRVDRHMDRPAWDRVSESFERLWTAGRDIDANWIAAYAARARARPAPAPHTEVEKEAPLSLPSPTKLQIEALASLEMTRQENRRRALIVMATGLGKTVVAALDLVAIARQTGRVPQVLWLAHRRELLEQAADTLRRGFPEARFAWMLGDQRPTEPFDMVFASVQTLSRTSVFAKIDQQRFEYLVVDEVHHADAPSYRRILSHFSPGFLLGLTATPERADEGDIPGIFDDNVPYRADLGTGISEELLVPFSYFGLADTTDYQPIPWRNGRFDQEKLSAALADGPRMHKLWEAWQEPDKAGSRTMVFCASIAHASFVRDWLKERGLHVRLCHGGPDSDDRSMALHELERGEIDAICSVDLFNEGIDCRPLDRVVMLRPTESPVLFLQQLGRGLRTAEGKERLVVIDFVGNHRVFLDRVRNLLRLTDKETSLHAFLFKNKSVLPPGCSVDIELEAIDLMKRLLPPEGSRSPVIAAYRELKAARGERPSAGELVRLGYSLSPFLPGHGGWFGFVGSEDDLSSEEATTLEVADAWLKELQSTPMTKCFKMVTLEVLLEAEALQIGMGLSELARRSHDYLVRSPELLEDLSDLRALPDPVHADPKSFQAYWHRNPIEAWTGSAWFEIRDDRFVSKLPKGTAALESMTRELVDARMASYRRRRAIESDTVVLKVAWNQRDPIIFLPTGIKREVLPSGDCDVRIPDGSAWRFRFMKVAINVAHPVGSGRNELPDLLRRWFGPHAGQPGTDFRIKLRPSPDGWWIEPMGEVLPEVIGRHRFVSFPTLKAAAGWEGSSELSPEAVEVGLSGPVGERQFAIRVSGSSMNGGAHPLHDGDWAIFEWARNLGIGALEGRVALVGIGDPDEGQDFHIKRVVSREGRFWLRSDNPEVEQRPADRAVVIARFVRSLRPESLAPTIGAMVEDIRLAFGLSKDPIGRIARVDGHLFLLAEGKGVLSMPDSWKQAAGDRRPGETAYILARPDPDSLWTYLGVGYWMDEEGEWAFPKAESP
jgi:superfamily II DNA or RNA helicase/diadenosine tetraphosphate (Ap4A) HIT family hydrolase/HKD family nuclease